MHGARGGNRVRHVHPPGQPPAIAAFVMMTAAWLTAAATGESFTGTIIAAILVLAGVVALAQRFGWIPAGGVAKAAQERADMAQRELTVALQEKALLEVRVRELEGRTNLQPLLEAQGRTADSIREMAEAMRDQSLAIRELARRGTP